MKMLISLRDHQGSVRQFRLWVTASGDLNQDELYAYIVWLHRGTKHHEHDIHYMYIYVIQFKELKTIVEEVPN